MQNQEMLTLAAKAVALEFVGFTTNYQDDVASKPCGRWGLLLKNGGLWNPALDDGDSFRLAADLEMNVFHVRGSCFAMLTEGEYEVSVSHADAGGRYAAARKAILSVAIDVGRQVAEQDCFDQSE